MRPACAQLGLAQRAEAAARGTVTPGATTPASPRVAHSTSHLSSGGAGVEHQRAAAEGLVVRVGDHHEEPQAHGASPARAPATLLGDPACGLLQLGARDEDT